MSSVQMSSFNIILFSTSNRDCAHVHVSMLHHKYIYICIPGQVLVHIYISVHNLFYSSILYFTSIIKSQSRFEWFTLTHISLAQAHGFRPNTASCTTSQLHSRGPLQGMGFMEKKTTVARSQIPSFPSPNTDFH